MKTKKKNIERNEKSEKDGWEEDKSKKKNIAKACIICTYLQ